jgi:hypothetical protein
MSRLQAELEAERGEQERRADELRAAVRAREAEQQQAAGQLFRAWSSPAKSFPCRRTNRASDIAAIWCAEWSPADSSFAAVSSESTTRSSRWVRLSCATSCAPEAPSHFRAWSALRSWKSKPRRSSSGLRATNACSAGCPSFT